MNVLNGTNRLSNKQNGENDHRGYSNISDRILRLIWNEHRISRIEIAKRLGLARSTVTEMVKEIIDSGFVNEVGTGKSKGGRKPIVLEFQDDTRCILGIDIGQNHVSVALTNLRGKLLKWIEKSYPVRSDLEGTLNLVMELSDACLSDAKEGQKLMGIGVALPSPIDPVNPFVIPEVVLPEWKGRNQLERISERYKVPVYIDNDANLGAIAEHRWGAGRGIRDLIYIKTSTGIGAGYILDGEIYRGATGSAGEIGHLPIDIYGKRCVCGLRGCLVNYVGQHALEAKAEQLLEDYPESSLRNNKPSIIDIENAALAGDKLGLRIVREAAEYLGTAIAGWLNIMNPGMVIFGGDLARTGELLLEPIGEKFRHCTLVNSVADVKITTGELGAQAIAIGAATLAIEEIFAEPGILKDRTHPAAI